ncbi:Citrate synthase 2, peroxisomal [Gracilariopsis chorda]|uniref:Citrate synthase n=1 Tax=Gracilariopsis chorda TaxID=448386 RepID=A0A2V3IKW3_9FLOR|nr:Citrate synthase 2, peroxisomal [Gracilariopsis chorda]|eukprot:PXF42679.1 Citrate synthase 2, peroxisomal [Gracilariopsis chorda]
MPEGFRGLSGSESPYQISIEGKHIEIPSGPLRSSTLYAAGLPRLYDPGFATTAAYSSSITFIDGGKGILRHRGYPIEQLVDKVGFDELSYLLIFGALPTAYNLALWQQAQSQRVTLPTCVRSVITAFSPSAHPMSILIAALSAMSASRTSLNPAYSGQTVYSDAAGRREAIVTCMSAMPVIVAAIYRHTAGLPIFSASAVPHKQSFATRFLHMLNGGDQSKSLANTLDILLMLHADHEQNCSTSAVRHLSSSGVDIFSSMCGGVAALYGPLHGGACESVLRMLTRIGNVDNIPNFLERVKRRQERLMGFGHRIYKNYDPRARIIQQEARRVFEVVGTVDPLIQVATELERTALQDDFFVQRKLYPNVDFYSGIIYKAMGFEPQFFPVLFALGRSAGWIAHWNEFLDDPDRRIARPHQLYIGVKGPRDVPDVTQRVGGQEFLDDRPVIAVARL